MYKKVLEEKAKLIEKLRNEFSLKLKDIESIFHDFIKNNYIDNIEVKDGRIVYNAKNLALTRNISNYNIYFTPQKRNVLKWLIDALLQIVDYNKKYYKEIESESKVLNSEDAVKKYLFDRIGYDGDKFIKNGWLFDLQEDDNLIRKTKAECLKAVVGGVSFKDFKGQIKVFVTGGQSNGIMEREWNLVAEDSFSNFDRGISNQYAVELGLDYAIYQGGLMGTSRPFCEARNNKVFSRKEILKWANIDFQGKPKVYDPIVDLGGYRCRHTLDWISEELARKIAPEKFGG